MTCLKIRYCSHFSQQSLHDIVIEHNRSIIFFVLALIPSFQPHKGYRTSVQLLRGRLETTLDCFVSFIWHFFRNGQGVGSEDLPLHLYVSQLVSQLVASTLSATRKCLKRNDSKNSKLGDIIPSTSATYLRPSIRWSASWDSELHQPYG